MRDVAALAGVSRTTVSLILNERDSRIPLATQQRVRRAADELEFRPSLAALQLRTRASRMLIFVSDEIASGPFAGGLIAGAQRAAANGSYSLMVMNTGVAGDVTSLDPKVLEDRQAEGLVFATVMTRRVDLPPADVRGPRVLLNCFSDDGSHIQVLPDDLRGGRIATEFVAEHGHREIAFVSGERDTYPATQRLIGYQQALAARGIPFRTELVRFGGWTAATGYSETWDLLGGPVKPTAIVCGNDRIAFGAYDAIRVAGLSVPGDVSVVGYDDQTEISEYMHPPLTTVRLPYQQMGQEAVEALLSARSAGTILIPSDLIVRGSVGRVRMRERS